MGYYHNSGPHSIFLVPKDDWRVGKRNKKDWLSWIIILFLILNCKFTFSFESPLPLSCFLESLGKFEMLDPLFWNTVCWNNHRNKFCKDLMMRDKLIPFKQMNLGLKVKANSRITSFSDTVLLKEWQTIGWKGNRSLNMWNPERQVFAQTLRLSTWQSSF